MPKGLPLRHRTRGARHLLAMSPEPSISVLLVNEPSQLDPERPSDSMITPRISTHPSIPAKESSLALT